MGLKEVTYKSCIELPCAGCLPANVYLCLKSELVKQGNLEGTQYLKKTIPAQLIATRFPSLSCTSSRGCPDEYTYKFRYDDSDLDGENLTLSCDDILGVFCKDCLTTWVMEQVDLIKVTFEEVLGVDSSVLDGELLAIAGLSSQADTIPYFTGVQTAALTSFTAFARSLVAATSQSSAQTVLGLTIGTNVQAYSTRLGSLAALAGTAANTIPYFNGADSFALTAFTGAGRSIVGAADFPAVRSLLSAAKTGDNSDIGTLNALTAIQVNNALSIITLGSQDISIGTDGIARWKVTSPNADLVPVNNAFVSVGSPTKRLSAIYTNVINFPSDGGAINVAFTNNYTLNVPGLTLSLGSLQAVANFLCTLANNLKAKGVIS